MHLNLKLKEKINESLSAVLPITGIVLMLSVFLVPMELGSIVMFLTGALMLIVGMGFFQLGAEMAMTPIGEGVGVQISKKKKLITVLLTGFVMGVIITVSEPDLQVLASQVPSVPNAVLILTVALGVGFFLALAIIRIRYKIGLSVLLIICYAALILVSLFVPKEFLAVAFDSGGVTTGPMTVPFIMAMGVGLASVRSDKNAASDSFGLVALSSVGPILAVLILGCFYKPTEAAYTLTDVATVVTTQDVARVFAQGLPLYAKEVLVSLLPIIAVCAAVIIVAVVVFLIVRNRRLAKQREAERMQEILNTPLESLADAELADLEKKYAQAGASDAPPVQPTKPRP